MDAHQEAEFNAREAGWKALKKFPRLVQEPKFVSGEQNDHRIRIKFYQSEDGQSFVGKVWFGPGCEGPPGHAHGGSIAAVMDEIMGGVAWMRGHSVVAARLTVNLRKMLPLEAVIYFAAKITKIEGKKVYTEGNLYSPGVGDYSDGNALFIKIDTTKLFGKITE